MLFDWFTAGAQILNFLILVYLLKRFLYGPILRAMDRREERIRDQVRAAEEEGARAGREADDYRRKALELEQLREAKLREVAAEADRRRRELVAMAKAEASGIRDAWNESIRKEQDRFMEDLRKLTAREVLRISRRSMADLARIDVTVPMTEALMERMDGLGEQERARFSRSAAEGPVLVRSSFSLTDALRERVGAKVEALCGCPERVEYSVDAEGTPGIEIVAGGLRLSWDVEGYFDDMEKAVRSMIDERTGPPPPGPGVS